MLTLANAHTPHTRVSPAQKYWITNASVHAQWCVVFAQLLIGGTNHGIHGFLVRWAGLRHGVSPPRIQRPKPVSTQPALGAVRVRAAANRWPSSAPAIAAR